MVTLDAKEYAKLLFTLGPQQHRKKRELEPLNVARDLKILLEDDKMNYGAVANRIKISIKQISEFLKLLEIPETVQDLIGWGNEAGRIDFSTAAKIVDAGNIDEMDKLAKTIISYDLKKQETSDIIQLLKKDISFEDAVQRVLNFRPKIEKGYAVIMITGETESNILKNASTQKHLDPAEFIRSMFEKYFEAQNIKSVIIKDRFVILTITEEAYLVLQSLPQKLGVTRRELLSTVLKNIVI